MKNNKNLAIYLLIFLVVNLMIIFGIYKQVNVYFICLSASLFTFLCYSIVHITKSVPLFAFNLTFLTFLVGREWIQLFIGYQGLYDYPQQADIHSYKVLLISIIFINLSFFFFQSKRNKMVQNIEKPIVEYLTASEVVFYLVYIPSMLYMILSVRYVFSFGYYNYFLNFYSYVKSNTLWSSLQLIDVMLPYALTLFMSVIPSRKRLIRVFLLYTLYLILSLATGQRGPFMLGLLHMFVYLILREDREKIITKNIRMMLYVAVPSMIFILTVLGELRTGGGTTRGETNFFVDFFVSQGVSITTIKNAFLYSHRFPEGKIYTLKFLYSGFLARILNLPIYYGNSIQNALYGNDFNHALGYIVLGKNYLLGSGTGTSYIAEAFHDGGYPYLSIMSILYGYLLSAITKSLQNPYLYRVVSLSVLTSLLWAPRGNATQFIADLITPSAVVLYIVTFVFYIALSVQRRVS